MAIYIYIYAPSWHVTMSHHQPSSCMWLHVYMLLPGMSLCPISSHLVVCGYIYIYAPSWHVTMSHQQPSSCMWLHVYMLPPGISLCPIISQSRYYCSAFLLSPSCSLARHLLLTAHGFHPWFPTLLFPMWISTVLPIALSLCSCWSGLPHCLPNLMFVLAVQQFYASLV